MENYSFIAQTVLILSGKFAEDHSRVENKKANPVAVGFALSLVYPLNH
jgi:hypothetical protein